jgi:hypothetical protein
VSRRDGQLGQIIVLFAGGLVTILLIAALVIDIGFTFMIRRSEQNAADPGAIAAARHIRTGPGGTPDQVEMRKAACFYAQRNGFFPGANGDVTRCTSDMDPNGTRLDVWYPPSAGAGPRFAGTPGYVEVVLSRKHQSFLAGIVGLTQIGVATSAVAAFSDGDSNASSLIALDPGGCGGGAAGHIHGGGTVNIHADPGVDGGYVHVNSSCSSGPADAMCSNGTGALKIDGGSSLTSPHTYVAGTCQANSQISGGPLTEGTVVIGDPLAELPEPKLTDYPNGNCQYGTPPRITTPAGPFGCNFPNGTVTLQPGVFYGGWSIGNRTKLILTPGLYIMAGGGIKITGSGEITDVAAAGSTPAPVMIFNTDSPTCPTGGPCQDVIDFSAQSAVLLRPIADGPYKGIVIWNDGTVRTPGSWVKLRGGTQLDVGGTIYSPKSLVTIDGGATVAGVDRAAVQVIAWQFDVGGNAGLDMPYDPNELYQFPSKGLVH